MNKAKGCSFGVVLSRETLFYLSFSYIMISQKLHLRPFVKFVSMVSMVTAHSQRLVKFSKKEVFLIIFYLFFIVVVFFSCKIYEFKILLFIALS